MEKHAQGTKTDDFDAKNEVGAHKGDKNWRLRRKNEAHLYDLLDVLDLVHELHLCHPPDVLELPDRPDHRQQKQKQQEQKQQRGLRIKESHRM